MSKKGEGEGVGWGGCGKEDQIHTDEFSAL